MEETRLWRRVVIAKFGEDWGGGLLSYEGEFTGVACEEVSGWVENLLAKTSSLRLG